MSTSLHVISSFSFPHEANLARASLEAANIPVFMENEHTVNNNWMRSNAMGGIKLLVPKEYVEEAHNILQTDFSAQLIQEIALAPDTVTCKFCGSHDLQPKTKGRTSAFLMIMLLGFPLLFIKQGMKCNACGKFNKD